MTILDHMIFDLMVGKFERHHIRFYNDEISGCTIIMIDDNEIFISISFNGSDQDMIIENRIDPDQWMYSFIEGTQETHIIEIHVGRQKASKKHRDLIYDYNLFIDSVLVERIGRKLDPRKSTTRTEVTIEKLSLIHFHILSDIEKKLYCRDIIKEPNWRSDWVYVQ